MARARAGEVGGEFGYAYLKVLERRVTYECRQQVYKPTQARIGPPQSNMKYLHLRVHYAKAKPDASYLASGEQYRSKRAEFEAGAPTPKYRLAA